MKKINQFYLAVAFLFLHFTVISQPYCESFDGTVVPAANKQQAFNIYGNGNAGFLQKWFVPSGTPSINASGDLAGVNAYSGNQYALQAICGISGNWSEGLMLQYNFSQNQNYSISAAVRNAPLPPNSPTPIDVDYILVPSLIPYTYNPNTGCSPTPAIPAGSLIVHTISNFSQNSWQIMSFNTGNLNANYAYLWIRPRFSTGAPLITTFFLTDSFCTRQLLCSPTVNLGNDTSICPGQSVSLNASNTNATYLWNTGETTPSITVSSPGIYSVTVTGECGLTDIAVDSITVSGDLIPPTALCQDITVALIGNSASITENDIDNGSSDNCSITLEASPLTFDCSNLGANTATLIATDGSGNSSSCTATVTVTDDTPPTALCQDITVALIGNSASITENDIDDGSSDNCSITLEASPLTFDCSNVGVNTVNLTATDGSGNSSSCTAAISVIDDTPPVAICQDITVALIGNSVSISENDIDNGSSDNCGFTLDANPLIFDCSDLGPNTVTLTVTDGEENSSSCTATVTVIDDTPPTAVCQDITASLIGNNVSILKSNIDDSSFDNCAIVTLSMIPALFDCSNLGVNTVTLTVTDASNNSATCTATVTVTDDTPPTAFCQDITVSLIGNSVFISENDIDNGSSDNCSITLEASPLTFDCSTLGANTVTLTVTDASNNSSTCTATVTVIDDTPPTALCQDITVALVGNSISISENDIDNGSSDNCSITLEASPLTFDCSNLGANTVTLNVTDASNNSSSCTATVTVTGVCTNPFTCSIVSVPANSNQVTGSGPNTIYLGYGPQSTTLSSSASVNDTYTYSWSPVTGLSCTNCASPVFTPVQEGNYTFILTMTNSSGGTSTCLITICVLDIRVTGNCNNNNGNVGNSPGKVYVCHVPPGNPANMQTICIGVAGVPAHVPLHGGDRLGRCNQICGSAKTEDEVVPELISDNNSIGLDILVFPNPYYNEFHVMVESPNDEMIGIKIFNLTGQLVLEKSQLEPNREVILGSGFVRGIYFVEIKQGAFKKVIRILKSE